ncbi:MAG: hypothetical protein PVH73_10560 [Candidatus Bathyarchaeota archaeon]
MTGSKRAVHSPSSVAGYCGVVPLKVKMVLRVCYAAKLNLVVTFN